MKINRRFISVLLAVIIALSAFSIVPAGAADADSAETGVTSGYSGSCTWTLNDNGVLEVYGEGSMDGIPQWNVSAVRRAVIRDGVTGIGQCAFSNCINMVSVTIADSVMYIGEEAFSGCSSLESLNIPNSVSNIGYYAFYNCTSLKRVYIPNSVSSISSTAFNNCSNAVICCNYNSYACSYAQNNGLAFSEIINYGTTGSCSWMQLRDGTLIISGDGMISGSIQYDRSLVTNAIVEYGVTELGDNIFSGCAYLRSVSLPDSLLRIGYSTFGDCQSLRRINIPSSVNFINPNAFINCGDLTLCGQSYSYVENYANNNNIPFVSVVSSGSVGACDWTIYNDGSMYVSGSGVFQYSSDWERYSVNKVIVEDGVTGIGSDAFYGCQNLTGVSLPNTVTSIGSGAFESCSSLSSVNIPESVNTIGSYAFGYCSALTSIEIPSTVNTINSDAFDGCYNLTIYGYGNSAARSYAQNNGFNFVAIVSSGTVAECTWKLYENGVMNISGRGAIYSFSSWNHSSVTSLVIEDGILGIGENVFSYCENLASVSIPDSLTYIGYNAFAYCPQLRRLWIPESVTSIDSSAFDGCTGLSLCGAPNSYVQSYASNRGIPFSTLIARGAAGDCSWTLYGDGVLVISGSGVISGEGLWNNYNVKEVVIENGIMGIGNSVFSGLPSLTKVTIPSSVISISSQAFAYCPGLTRLTIPDSVTIIDYSAFIGSYNLTLCGSRYSYAESFAHEHDIPFASLLSAGSCGDGCSWEVYDDGVLFISGSGSLSRDYQWTNYSIYEVIIESGVISIGDSTFSNLNYLHSVTIPDTVVSIGYNAFYDCGMLESINIPNSVTYIGDYAFNNCVKLGRITIPASVTNICSGAFNNCSGLIICGVRNSYAETFANAANIRFVSIVAKGSSGSCSWELCDDGTLFISGVGTLGGGFDSTYRSQIKEVVIENGVTGIGTGVFYDCPNLRRVSFPETLSSIGNDAFENCPGLRRIYIPDTVYDISQSAFMGCPRLTICGVRNSFAETYAHAQNIPFACVDWTYDQGNVTWTLYDDGVLVVSGSGMIGYNSQLNRLNVREVIIEDGVTSIGEGAFSECPYLSSVTIPDSVTEIRDNAFSLCYNLRGITIPDSVTYIGSNAFSNCNNLSAIYAHNNTYASTYAGGKFKPILGECTFCGLSLNEDNLVYIPDEPATCTYSGFADKTVCPDCGCVFSCTTIPAFGHAAVTDQGKAATCTETGLTAGSHCVICGRTIKAQTVIPATGHTPVVDEAVEPGCATFGLTEGSHCSVCGEILTAQQAIPVLGHEYAIVDAEPADCTHSGLTAGVKCTRCDQALVAQTEIPATGHTEVIDEAVAGDCTHDSKTQGSHCSVCGEVIVPQVVTPAPGHTVVVDEAVEPGCVTCGLTAGSHCSVCGEVLEAQESVPMLGHEVAVIEAVPADCTHSGLTAGVKCTRCDQILVAQTEIPATGHKEIVEEVVAGDCTHDGKSQHSYCSVCGEVIVPQVVTPAPGHTYVADQGYAPSCDHEGLTDGFSCSVCGEVFIPQVTIPAVAHTLTFVPEVEATYYDDGVMAHYECEVCGKLFMDADGVTEAAPSELVIPMLVNDNTLFVSFSPSTCTYNGKQRNPAVIVKDEQDKVLVEGVDYTVEVPEGRINAGDYIYTVSGIGDYAGLMSQGVFTIKQLGIKATLNMNKLAFTGKQRNPKMIVKDANGNALTDSKGNPINGEGVDFILTVPEGRTNAGAYTYTVTGVGNYKGTVVRTLTIGNVIHAQLNTVRVKYTGKERNPKLNVFYQMEEKDADGNYTFTNIALTEDQYDVIIPEGRIQPGEYVYTVTGKPEKGFFGTVTLTLTIYEG